MKKLFFLFLFLIPFSLFSQELNCQVSVITQNVQVSDKKFFENMQTAIYELINNQRWTNFNYKAQERLDCSITINITELVSRTEFKSQITMQLRRPVFNSNYTTTLINYINTDFRFTYDDAIPITYDPNSFTSNLTSTLAFYAYIFLGLDGDSFSPNGGKVFFSNAQNIVQVASSSGNKGWKANDGTKSNYSLAENYTNNTYQKLHDANYSYHRKGLDLMSVNQTSARAGILQGLKDIHEVYKQQSGLFAVQLFMEAKIDELISIFTPAPKEEQDVVMNIVRDVNPVSITKLEKAFKQ